jgi:hypothetical protein
MRGRVVVEFLLQASAELVLEARLAVPRQVQHEVARLRVASFHGHHQFDTVAAALGCYDCNKIDGLLGIPPYNIAADFHDFLMSESHIGPP